MAVLGHGNDGELTYRDSTSKISWVNGSMHTVGTPNLNALELLMRSSGVILQADNMEKLRGLRTKRVGNFSVNVDSITHND